MPFPTLDELVAGGALAPCEEILASTIGYRAAGASTYANVRAHVLGAEVMRQFDNAKASEQDVTVEVDKNAVPARPDGSCRVILPGAPATTYKPVNVVEHTSRDHWVFELVKVNA